MTKQEIISNIEKRIDNAKVNDRFSIFMFNCVKDKVFDENIKDDYLEMLYDILEPWDDQCKLPYNTGVLLNELEQDNTIIPTVHRTFFKYEDINGYKHNNDLDDIMCNGLINQGHTNATGGPAVEEGAPNLSLTMTDIKDIGGILNIIASYRGSNTTIVAAFPKTIVDKNLTNLNDNEIYDIHNGYYYIKPKYILGALIKNDNNLDSFYLKNEILERRYNLDNDKNNQI